MMAGEECKKSWVCPSNRLLQLRGRLNYGWSFNTTNIFRKVEAIPSAELEAIEKVLNRAREVEQVEADRVGRLICRLETISRNAAGDGVRSCSMCGIGSRFFRNSFVNCLDCARAVCEKCRMDFVDYTLCIVCSENREVWKKSGGWFYGRFPVMTEKGQKECTALLTGSPRAFNKWEHIAPEIVRLESFEPPEENHNDHSLYKDWSMNSVLDLNTDDVEEKGENPAVDETSSTESHIILDLNSADDVSDYEEVGIYEDTSCIELATICKSYSEPEPIDAQLSASCPSLPDLQEPKLKRKGSIRRKKVSASARKMIRKFSNLLHPH